MPYSPTTPCGWDVPPIHTAGCDIIPTGLWTCLSRSIYIRFLLLFLLIKCPLNLVPIVVDVVRFVNHSLLDILLGHWCWKSTTNWSVSSQSTIELEETSYLHLNKVYRAHLPCRNILLPSSIFFCSFSECVLYFMNGKVSINIEYFNFWITNCEFPLLSSLTPQKFLFYSTRVNKKQNNKGGACCLVLFCI